MNPLSRGCSDILDSSEHNSSTPVFQQGNESSFAYDTLESSAVFYDTSELRTPVTYLQFRQASCERNLPRLPSRGIVFLAICCEAF